ncbi:hypothetical protein BGW38_005157 [Lunasporangiospora selenospora]|uniref:Cwf15/Cwc15 cell cycle control protein n=1 Tax=Lunasporangiospora selenospora TaxID=979761 RepID=A0A9P6KBP7_9FUNG|nr:hypothetical protein BGW38_005157 [Lunasporangiospora selenospora]
MTTAARPTFDPARGKGTQAPTRIYSSRDLASHTTLKFRQSGQTTQNDLTSLDLKAQLKKAEQEHFAKINKVTSLASGLSNSFKDNGDDDDDNAEAEKESEEVDTETPMEKKRRLLKEAEELDKDDSDDSGDDEKDSDDSDSDDSDDDDDDDEDDTAELLRELEKIKRERAEEKERLERLQREEEEKEREAQAAKGNPLLEVGGDSPASGGPKDFSVKRRWDEDVVFKNQARGMDEKPKKRFINDTLRSDFHRKFMNQYVQ